MNQSAASIALGALLGCACASDEPGDRDATTQPEAEPQPVALDEIFDKAAASFDVPPDLLRAIGYVETRWQMVAGHEHSGADTAHGVMALRGPRIAEAAHLLGVDPEVVKSNVEHNILGAAAILDTLAEEENIARADLGAWLPAVERYSQIRDAEARWAYTDNVFELLQSGVSIEGDDGAAIARIGRHQVERPLPPKDHIAKVAGADQPYAVWRPSPNHNARPAGPGGEVSMVIIHTCEGSYAGCWGWLKNPASGVSAHYVVNDDGTEVSQLVAEADRGWHIGATYDCANNGDAECGLNGSSSNNFTVGIEHAGYASQPSWAPGLIETSAQLTCDIAVAHDIPIDKYHIVGHGQLQPWNRYDPGPNWPWTHYLSRVHTLCNGSAEPIDPPPPSPLVIDSNNFENDVDKGYVEASSSWFGSAYYPGYYGTGYRYATGAPVSDAASFWFYLDEAGTHDVDAWWNVASNRSGNVPFLAFGPGDIEYGRTYVDQRTDGNQWNHLGQWQMQAGWNRILVSRWTNDSSVVVADAIRVR